MKTDLRRSLLAVLAIGLTGLLAALSGCVASDGGYGGEAVYGADYYEPYGYEYGRLHPGYHVAPPRRDRDDRGSRETSQRPARVESRPSTPAYRPAAPSRPAPSIPSKPRSRSH
jgi:hypothetical protein